MNPINGIRVVGLIMLFALGIMQIFRGIYDLGFGLAMTANLATGYYLIINKFEVVKKND